MRERYPDNLAIIYRHYPFKGQSLLPALAGICAGHQNRLEALHDRYVLMYDSLPADSASLAKSLEAEGWIDLARNSGIPDLSKFIGCVTEDQTLRELALDRDAARLLGVAVVPTLLVNETRVVGNPGYARLAKMLEHIRSRFSQQ
jgi:protein-disulfide isomerase